MGALDEGLLDAMRGGYFLSPTERQRLAALQEQQTNAARQNPDDPLREMLNRMRAEGDRFPNFGEAFDRLEKKSRKYVESRVIEPKQITGEKA